jgi:hypothetical protein
MCSLALIKLERRENILTLLERVNPDVLYFGRTGAYNITLPKELTENSTLAVKKAHNYMLVV